MGNQEQAETLALQALAYLFSTPKLTERFLSETGFTPAQVKADAQAPEVLEAALAVLSNDEALLLAFAANNALAPEDIVSAFDLLASGRGRKRPLSST